MKRRKAIRNVVLLSAAATITLDSCLDKASVTLRNIPLTGSQEDLLAELTEAIIPTTDFVGAKGLKSHEFVLIMADECSTHEDQEKFMEGMKQFDVVCKEKFNNRFAACPPAERTVFLKLLEAEDKSLAEELIRFYRTVKRYTIQSFTSSEPYLREVRNYSLVPPPYNGCLTS